jgi:hypothetical protein
MATPKKKTRALARMCPLMLMGRTAIPPRADVQGNPSAGVIRNVQNDHYETQCKGSDCAWWVSAGTRNPPLEIEPVSLTAEAPENIEPPETPVPIPVGYCGGVMSMDPSLVFDDPAQEV